MADKMLAAEWLLGNDPKRIFTGKDRGACRLGQEKFSGILVGGHPLEVDGANEVIEREKKYSAAARRAGVRFLRRRPRKKRPPEKPGRE